MIHNWPKDPEEHAWGPWFAKTGIKLGVKPTQYRQCIDPLCHAIQVRDAPR